MSYLPFSFPSLGAPYFGPPMLDPNMAKISPTVQRTVDIPQVPMSFQQMPSAHATSTTIGIEVMMRDPIQSESIVVVDNSHVCYDIHDLQTAFSQIAAGPVPSNTLRSFLDNHHIVGINQFRGQARLDKQPLSVVCGGQCRALNAWKGRFPAGTPLYIILCFVPPPAPAAPGVPANFVGAVVPYASHQYQTPTDHPAFATTFLMGKACAIIKIGTCMGVINTHGKPDAFATSSRSHNGVPLPALLTREEVLAQPNRLEIRVGTCIPRFVISP